MMRHAFGPGGSRAAVYCALAIGGLALSGCADSKKSNGVDSKYGVKASPRVVQPGQPIPKGGGTYRVGKPYVVAGRTYYPEDNRRYRGEGIASWYGDDFHGRLTANGEVYDMHGISAAHPTLPIPSYARVTNLQNGRSLIVRINDRGPYHNDRIIDLSAKAADLLQFRRHGVSRVKVEYAGPASLDGSDDRRLMATLSQGRPAQTPSALRVAAPKPFVPERPVARMAAAPRAVEYEPQPMQAAPRRAGAAGVSVEPLPPPSTVYAPPGGVAVGVGRGLY
jgi:rare lipoprotein A